METTSNLQVWRYLSSWSHNVYSLNLYTQMERPLLQLLTSPLYPCALHDYDRLCGPQTSSPESLNFQLLSLQSEETNMLLFGNHQQAGYLCLSYPEAVRTGSRYTWWLCAGCAMRFWYRQSRQRPCAENRNAKRREFLVNPLRSSPAHSLNL